MVTDDKERNGLIFWGKPGSKATMRSYVNLLFKTTASAGLTRSVMIVNINVN